MNQALTIDDIRPAFEEVVPREHDRKLILGQLMRSIGYCEALGCSAWAVSVLPNGFRLNVGQVETLSCEITVTSQEPTAGTDFVFADLRLLMSGEGSTSAVRDLGDLAGITPMAYASVGAPHWCYGATLQTDSGQSSTALRQLETHLAAVAPFHRKFIEAACFSRTGNLRTRSNFAQHHSEAFVNYAKQVVTSDGLGLATPSRVDVTFDASAAVPFYNELVSEAIERSRSPWGGGGKSMRVGVCTPDGASVYRVHDVSGMGEWMGLVDELLDAGFVDLIANVTHPSYDALFAPTAELLAATPPQPANLPSVAEDIDAASVQLEQLPSTERAQVVMARVGQGRFRETLLEAFGGSCALTGFSFGPALRASHIKPWRDASNEERLAADNGLLLRADIDALFDGGYISFSDDGKLLMSTSLPTAQAKALGLEAGLTLRFEHLTDLRRTHLTHHRDRVFVLRNRANHNG